MGSRESSEKISTLLEEIQSISLEVVEGIAKNAQIAEKALTTTVEAKHRAFEVQRHAQQTEDISTTVSAAAAQQSQVSQQIALDVVKVQEAATNDLKLALGLREMFEDIKQNNQRLSTTLRMFTV